MSLALQRTQRPGRGFCQLQRSKTLSQSQGSGRVLNDSGINHIDSNHKHFSASHKNTIILPCVITRRLIWSSCFQNVTYNSVEPFLLLEGAKSRMRQVYHRQWCVGRRTERTCSGDRTSCLKLWSWKPRKRVCFSHFTVFRWARIAARESRSCGVRGRC